MNDAIFVFDGLHEDQDVPPTLTHTLEVHHGRRGGGRAVEGVCALAMARSREMLFVGVNGVCLSVPTPLCPCLVDCSVQVWSLPHQSGDGLPACMHVLPTGYAGSITAMTLADTRLLTWGTDGSLRVWEVFPTQSPPSGSSSSLELDVAPWEMEGGAPHPSLIAGGGAGTFDGEEPFEWESDGETEDGSDGDGDGGGGGGDDDDEGGGGDDGENEEQD